MSFAGVETMTTRELVIVNTTAGFLTPTSGAIAVWIRSIQEQALRSGVRVHIISRAATEASYDLPDLHLISYPELPKGRVRAGLTSRQSGLRGWTHSREYVWADMVRQELVSIAGEDPIVITHNDPALASHLSSYLQYAEIVHLFHNTLPWSKRVRSDYRRRIRKSLAVSDYVARWVEAEFILPTGSVCTLYNGVDLVRFSSDSERSDKEAIAHGAALPVINYSGLINRNKGVDTLLRSLLLLAGLRNDFSVQLLGNVGSIHGVESEDDFAALLYDLIGQLQARGVLVDRPGYLPWDEIPSRLARASIHVVPSRWQEPFPLSALEGMACGLATVTSTSGGLPELVGEAGLTFDAEDVKSLAGHLEKLVSSPDLRAEYGKRARQRAEMFTWNRTWEALYVVLGMNSANNGNS